MNSLEPMGTRTASRGSIAAPSCVLFGGALSAAALFVASRGAPVRLVQEAGSFSYLAFMVFAMALVASAILVYVASRGSYALAALTPMSVLVPWGVMVLCMLSGAEMVADVVTGADLESKRAMTAMGTSEIMSARILGASMVLGSAVTLGIAMLALHRARLRDTRTRGDDALAAIVLFGVAALALCILMDASSLRRGLGAVARADASSRVTLLRATLADVRGVELMSSILLGLTSLLGLVCVVFAHRRGGGGALVVASAWLAGMIFGGGDLATTHAVARATALEVPWSGAPGFAPTAFSRTGGGDFTTGPCLATPSRFRCGEGPEARYDRLGPSIPRVDAEAVRQNEALLMGSAHPETPELFVMLDARVGATALRQLLARAQSAGYRSLVIIGGSEPLGGAGTIPPLLRSQIALVSATTWLLGPPTLPRRPATEHFIVVADDDTAQSVAARADVFADGNVYVVATLPTDGVAMRDPDTAAGALGTGTEGMMGRDVPAVPPADAPTGPLDAATLQRIMRANLPAIRRCYESALQTNPTLAGRIDVRFAIAPRGAVTTVSSTGTLDSPAVARCIETHVASIAFPSDDRREPMSVSYPFVFNAAP